MKILKFIFKASVWLALCVLPIILMSVSWTKATEEQIADVTVLFITLFFINPVYVALISYYFINKRSVAFLYLGVVSPWILPCLPYITRTNDDWLMIAEFELYAGIYQIAGITLSFAVACIVKYIILHKEKDCCNKKTRIIKVVKWILFIIAIPIIIFLVAFILDLTYHM